MKKIILLSVIFLNLTFVIAQSPCCKNKDKTTPCKNSTQSVDVIEESGDDKPLSACCKGKAKEGLACSKQKVDSDCSNCSPKMWWQFWKKGCDKNNCKK